ncbi:MAG: domain containing protein [Frankiales bacterium]|nr:domain containing protein [Frankiales bacterium]
MGVLQRFERRLESLVEGAFAKAFKGWVEPVEVAAALTREAEDKKAIVAAGRVLVPNSYVVELGRSDADRLKEYDEPLRKELAAMVGEEAKERGWSFVGPVEVAFEEVDGLATGTFQVRSAVAQGQDAGQQEQPATGPYLEVGGRQVPVSGTVVLGRGTDVDVQLTDTGVSRRHAQIDRSRLTDLGSTNGTRLNGTRVAEADLHDGDRITVGSTEIVFRSGA